MARYINWGFMSGLGFLLVSLASSYVFRNSDYFKLSIFLVIILIFFTTSLFEKRVGEFETKKEGEAPPRSLSSLSVLGLCLLPILGTFIGSLLNPNYFSFFSWIEICSVLTFCLWSFFLYFFIQSIFKY